MKRSALNVLLAATLASHVVAPPAAMSAASPVYTEPSTGLKFAYPAGAKVEAKPDNDTLVKISGQLPQAACGFAITINKTDVAPGTPSQTLLNMLIQNCVRQLKQPSVLSEQPLYLGTRSQFNGNAATIRFTDGHDWYFQKWAVFSDPQAGGRLRVLMVMTNEKQVQPLDRLFADVSASLTHDTAIEPAVERRTAYSVEGITFQYPDSWTLIPYPDRDTLVKVNGPNIGINLASLPSEVNMSLDQLQRILENDYLSKLPRIKMITDRSTSYGSGISGQEATYTFEVNGQPCYAESFMFARGGKLYHMQIGAWGMEQAAVQKQARQIFSSLVVH